MKYEYWFANIRGITGTRKIEIRKEFDSIKELYFMTEKRMLEKGLNIAEVILIQESIKSWEMKDNYKRMEEENVYCVPFFADGYPEKLKEIPAPPYMLYIKGKLPKAGKKTVAIVGARECSNYGAHMAREFASALARADVQIISGMARGIDSIAQRAALNAGGESFAVLGCGVDRPYPSEEKGLYTRLCQEGGVISEYPIGTAPLRQNFPARNRIISGLADVILVMEAKERSGSLITADMALEQGRDVYALPGMVNSALSYGCNHLLKQGAGVLISPEELLEDLGIKDQKKGRNCSAKKILLETDENMVYSCLDLQPQKLDELVGKTGMRVPDLLDVLVRLEVMGLVEEYSKNNYVKL